MLKFLTPEELESLTGYKRAAAQRKWLEDNDLPYMEGGDGLKVLEQIVLGRLGGTQQKKKEPQLRLTG